MNDLRNELTSARSEQLAWLETGVLTLAFPVVGFLIDRGNPLLLGYDFAWVAVPPLLIGLRHGFVRAASSGALLLAAGWLVGRFLPSAAHAFAPDAVMVGTMLLATLAGLFADAHRRQLNDLRESSGVLWRRHQVLARDFLMLDVSHARLAQHVGGSRWNLRSLLEGTRSWSPLEGEPTLDALATAVLALVESQGLVEVASVHAVHDDTVVVEPAARLGAAQPVSADDPLIRFALNTKAIAVVHQSDMEEESQLLAAVPFVDVDGTCRGVLAIHSMPFIAFEDENLKLFAALAGRIGDMLAGVHGRRGNERKLLELFLKRAHLEARQQGACYAMAVITFRAQSEASQLLEFFAKTEVRDSDSAVLLYDEHAQPVLCVFLPMTKSDDAKGFERRVSEWCQGTLGKPLLEAGGEVRLVRVGLPRTAKEVLQEILYGGVCDEIPNSGLRTDLPHGG